MTEARRASRVVVVDDSPEYLELMRDVLRDEAGCEPTCLAAEDGVRDAISEARPDLLILDLRLRQADDGFRLVRWARKQPTLEPVPILVATADQRGLRQRLVQLARFPEVEVLAKPFDLQELLAVIDWSLKRSSAVRHEADESRPRGRLVIAAGGEVIDANAASAEMLGTSVRQLLGARAEELTTWPRERILVERQRLGERGRWEGVVPLRRGDGGTLEAVIWTSVLGAGDDQLRRVTLAHRRVNGGRRPNGNHRPNGHDRPGGGGGRPSARSVA